MSKVDDILLIEKCLNGQTEAFAALYNKYYKNALYFVINMVHNYEIAEDICQEVFINIFNNLEKYNPNYSFYSWLCSSLKNKAIDYYRKNKSNVISIDEDIKIDREDKNFASLPDKFTEINEVLLKIDEVIDELPAHYKKAILLKIKEDCSYNDIADKMNIRIEDVKIYLYRARKFIKEKLIQLGLVD